MKLGVHLYLLKMRCFTQNYGELYIQNSFLKVMPV